MLVGEPEKEGVARALTSGSRLYLSGFSGYNELIMDKTLEQLAQYIGQQLRQGMPENDIRASLMQNRWTQDWIDAAFNIVHQNPGTYGATASLPQNSYDSIQQERRGASKKKQFLLLGVIFFLMAAVAVGAYFLFQSDKTKAPAPVGSNQSQTSTRTPDDERKGDLNALLSDLADLYVASGSYPTYASIKTAEFVAQNSVFAGETVTDPDWTARNASCTNDGKPILAAAPAPGCYAYSATAQDGAACDGAAVPCIRMTVTTVLSNGNLLTVVLERNIEIED